MSLEEKLHELAKKGELVHVSIAASGKEFRAVFAASSSGGGYATGVDADPVRALMEALCAPIKKAKRSSTRPSNNESNEPVLQVPASETDNVDASEPPQKTARLSSYM